MSMRIGIYDFFAFTLPGGLYLVALYFSLELADSTIIKVTLKDLTAVNFLLLGAAAYVLGLLCTPIAFRLWNIINGRPDIPKEALARVLERFPHFEFRCAGNEWPILHSRISLLNEGLGARVDKHRATGIMLRNTAPALAALALVCFAAVALQKLPLLGILGGLGLLFAAYLSNHQCKKYLRWSYSLIFETVVAEGLEISDIVRLNKWSVDSVDTDSKSNSS